MENSPTPSQVCALYLIMNVSCNGFIIGGNTDNKFTLNSTTGQLSCRPLNREQASLHNLTIEARDGGSPARSSHSSFLITVLDDNDNDPEFLAESYTAEVYENIAVGTSVLRVQAMDRDAGVNAEISYSINNAAQGQFILNNITGVLSTAG
jgi:protocadherin-16/23